MKIFLSFMNGLGVVSNRIPCFYEAFVDGLLSAGHDLLVFNRYGMICGDFPGSGEVLAQVKEWQPDLIIAFNNFGLDWSRDFDCPIFVYEVDSPLYYDNVSAIRARPDRYRFLVLQEKSRRILEDDWHVPPSCIFMTRNFTAVRAENVPYERNVVFIGSRFWPPAWKFPWVEFRSRNPSDAEIGDYRKMLESIASDPFQSPEKIAASFPSVAPDAAGLANLIGALSGEKRVRLMSALSDLGLEIYGTPNWIENGSDPYGLNLAYRSRQVFSIADNQNIYNSSRLCVNVNHLQAVSTFSWRVYDIMASRGCLVTEYRPDVKRLFPDVPIPTFTSEYEAREICKHLLANENERLDIVAACNAAIERGCRFDAILEVLEAALNQNLHGEGRGRVDFLSSGNEQPAPCQPKAKAPHYGIQGFRLMLSAIPGLGRLVNREKILWRLGV